MDELEPCPFCGSDKWVILLWRDPPPTVHCHDCGIDFRLGLGSTNSETVKAWNRRDSVK